MPLGDFRRQVRIAPVLAHRGAKVPNSGTMTEYDTGPKEGIASMTDRARNADVFGVDQEGYDHRVDSRNEVVFRTRGTGDELEIERVERLGQRTLAHWVGFVDDQVGWVDVWLECESFGEAYKRKRAARAEA